MKLQLRQGRGGVGRERRVGGGGVVGGGGMVGGSNLFRSSLNLSRPCQLHCCNNDANWYDWFLKFPNKYSNITLLQ